MNKFILLLAFLAMGILGCVKVEPVIDHPVDGITEFSVKLDGKDLVTSAYATTRPANGPTSISFTIEDPADATQIALLSVDIFNVPGKAKAPVLSFTPGPTPDQLTKPYAYVALIKGSGVQQFVGGEIEVTDRSDKAISMTFDTAESGAKLTGKIDIEFK
jgi:hypothetical protein